MRESLSNEELIAFKAAQKESWALFAPLEAATIMPAATLVKFANVTSEDRVLDVGCGTGVVAITAARLGASVHAVDLSPALIARAQENRLVSGTQFELQEGDVESLSYPDNSFDVVLSQFGHMFAPRPEVATKEMLRVLKPGGTIAFSTWPPDLYVGRLFKLVSQYSPPPAGVSLSSLWGDPNFVRQQLGVAVEELLFSQGLMRFPALSIGHYCQSIERTLAPLVKLIQDPKTEQGTLKRFRIELEALASLYYRNNYIHQNFLMSRAKKIIKQ